MHQPDDTNPFGTTICLLCGSIGVEFGKLCETCKGNGVQNMGGSLNPKPTPEDQTHVTAETTGQVCGICGGPFEPYRIGPNWVIKPNQCYKCLMRKKYGPDWNGRTTGSERKKRSNERAREVAKQMPPKAQSKTPPSYHTADGSFHGDFILHLTFNTRDHAMYRRIQQIATKERRTTDQQVMYYLDRVLGGVISEMGEAQIS